MARFVQCTHECEKPDLSNFIAANVALLVMILIMLGTYVFSIRPEYESFKQKAGFHYCTSTDGNCSTIRSEAQYTVCNSSGCWTTQR